MSAKDKLVETLTNLLAISRVGRLDEHRETAKHLVAEVLHEAANELREEAWPHERDERENELIYSLAAKIDPYEESRNA